MKIFHRGMLFLSFIFLMACSEGHIKNSMVLKSQECPEIQNLEPLLEAENPRVIIIGEGHGMQEPPAFMEALLCHSLERGFKTNLALELSDDVNLYKTYLNSGGLEADKSALFEDWAWKGEFTDGRSSEAILRLIDKARSYMAAEQDLIFTAFKADDLQLEDFESRNAYMQAYEKKMAENILKSSETAHKTIVLVGNLHARRYRLEANNLSYDLMAKHMPAPYTASFFIAHNGGTSWSCRGPQPKDCMQYKSGSYLDANSELAKLSVPRIISNDNEVEILPFIGRQYKKEWYDGVIYVGAVTASPPANADGRVPYVEDNK